MTGEPTRRSSERRCRIAWLRARPARWAEVNPTDFKASHHLIQTIAADLSREGLYSPNTLRADVEMGVFKLIRELLKEPIH